MGGKDKPTAEELKALIAELYLAYGSYLTDYAQNSGCNPYVAEDLVQETFTIALQKSLDLYQAASRRGWLIRTLRNLIGNQQRNIRYAQKLLKRLEKQASDSHTDELSPLLLYKGMISEDDLNLLLRYWDYGDSVESIAKDLNLKIEACKKRIQRAKARFKKAYEEQIGRLE